MSVEDRVDIQIELWKREGLVVPEWGWKEGIFGPLD